MKTAIVNSRCECQATLGAELDEHRHIISAWAQKPGADRAENAAATSIGSEKERFDIGWSCPLCERNVLRSYTASGLVWQDEE